jgi:DNA-binding protein H-NS
VHRRATKNLWSGEGRFPAFLSNEKKKNEKINSPEPNPDAIVAQDQRASM